MPSKPQSHTYLLRTLAELCLENAEGENVKLRTRKSLLLLACLVLDPDRAWTRDRLATLFWGDRMDKQAKSSLRSALSDIRRSLGETAVIVSGNHIRANTAIVSSDFEILRRAVASEQFQGVPGLGDLSVADFLIEFDGDDEARAWADAMRSELRELATRVFEHQVNTLSASGDVDAAIQIARHLLALDPLREESHRTLMSLYAANGERSKAIAQFHNCRDLMLHELNVEPSFTTKALADEIAVTDVVALSAIRELGTSAEADVQPTQHETSAHQEPMASRDTARRAIAVMPFINMSGDADQNYFADGIAEDIVTDLSQIADLDVVSAGSMTFVRGGKYGPETVASELGVDYVLEGSVRKFDRNIRVTIRLVDGQTSRQIWAERYDREMRSIFELQSEIASSVVSALQLHFVPNRDRATSARGTRNIEAHESYLRGRAFLKEMTEHSVELSLKSFKSAIELDPDYALALAGFADSVMMLAFHHTVADDMLEEARLCCEKALRIDPALAEVHCSLGRLHAYHSEFELGEKQFKMALRLAPDLHEAHLYNGLMYLVSGFAERALPLLARAYALDNQELQTSMMFMSCQQTVGDTDAAKTTAKTTLKLCRKRIKLNPYDDRAIYVGAMALVVLEQMEEAGRWAEMAATFESDDGRTTYNIACLFGSLNDFENAEPFIRKTLALGVSDHKLNWFRYIDHDFEQLRTDPRFDEIFVEWEQSRKGS